MARITKAFIANGTDKIFKVDQTISSISHIRVDVGEDLKTIDDFEIRGNSVFLKETPVASSVVKITVSTDSEGLYDDPDDTVDILAQKDLIISVGLKADEITTTGQMTSEITTVNEDEANINLISPITNDVEIVSSEKTSLANLAGESVKVSDLAGASSEIVNVSNTKTDIVDVDEDKLVISSVSAKNTEIAEIATDIDSIIEVSGNSQQVKNISNEISSIDKLNEKYIIAGSEPVLGDEQLFTNEATDITYFRLNGVTKEVIDDGSEDPWYTKAEMDAKYVDGAISEVIESSPSGTTQTEPTIQVNEDGSIGFTTPANSSSQLSMINVDVTGDISTDEVVFTGDINVKSGTTDTLTTKDYQTKSIAIQDDVEITGDFGNATTGIMLDSIQAKDAFAIGIDTPVAFTNTGKIDYRGLSNITWDVAKGWTFNGKDLSLLGTGGLPTGQKSSFGFNDATMSMLKTLYRNINGYFSRITLIEVNGQQVPLLPAGYSGLYVVETNLSYSISPADYSTSGSKTINITFLVPGTYCIFMLTSAGVGASAFISDKNTGNILDSVVTSSTGKWTTLSFDADNPIEFQSDSGGNGRTQITVYKTIAPDKDVVTVTEHY